MQLLELMQNIQSNSIPSFLMFTGEEIKVRQLYIDKICEVTGSTKVVCSTVAEAVSRFTKRSILQKKNCFVVYDDNSYIKEQSSWGKVKELVSSTNHILILVYNTLDKRSSFYKQLKDEFIVFEHVSDEVLLKYINKEVNLKEEYAQNLIDNCNHDYNIVLLELDKIKKYNTNHNYSYEELSKQGLISSTIGDITFLLTDSILYGDYIKALNYTKLSKTMDISVLAIISILYSGFRNMLMVQGSPRNVKLDEYTGLQYWQIKQAQKNMGGYSINEILRNLDTLREVEQGIKTGAVEESIALDYLTLKLLR